MTEVELLANLLELEITEGLLLSDDPETDIIMKELSELGVRLSIDDFGTGYSSLSYLKRFPFDVLKIDRAFIKDVTNDPEDAALTRAISAMAQELGVKVIGEGVETAEQLEFLRTEDCNMIQGYYISRPMPADAFITSLKSRYELHESPAGYTETLASLLLGTCLVGARPCNTDPMITGIAIRFLALVGAISAAVSGYTWYWHYAADQVRDGVPAFQEAARAEGYVVNLSEPQISGYPYRIVIAFGAVEVAPLSEDPSLGGRSRNWAIKLDDMIGYVQPWNLSHAIFDFGGGATVTWNGVDYIGAADTALMSLAFIDDLLQRLSTDVTGMNVNSPSTGVVFSAQRAQFHMERQISSGVDRDSFRVSVSTDDLAVPEGLRLTFVHLAPQISQMHGSGTLVNRGTKSASASDMIAQDWLLRLSDLSVNWSPIEILGTGELSLDGKKRPQGSIHARSRGHEAIVDSLETTGVLSNRKAVATKTVLELLRTSSNEDGPNDGLMPINIDMQDGRLYLGPVKLMKVQPLW